MLFFFFFPLSCPFLWQRTDFFTEKDPSYCLVIQIGKETEKIQKGNNTWKWVDLKVVICSSNSHLEISSLSPHICICHHALVLVYKIQINHTSNSTQQKCIQATTLKVFLSYSKQVSLMSAITCNFWSPLTGDSKYTSRQSLQNWINTGVL